MSFHSARKFTIHNATFNASNHYNSSSYHDQIYAGPSQVFDAMKALREAGAIEATHTSKTAEYAPKCKPGSRILVIRDIMDWVTAEGCGRHGGPDTSILWFHGPAGGGKTCIMREVASRCQQARILAGSYFFSTRVRGLDNDAPFIATIAYQLAAKSALLRAEILQALSEDHALFQSSGLLSQMQKVIIEPLLATAERIPDDGSNGRARVIVIDGFDECQDPISRQHLLSVLYELVRPITRNIRLLVVVASRPELDIRRNFESPRFTSITHVLRLQDYDGASDIRDYFCDEFCRIRQTHPAKAVIPESWPAEYILNILVDKSSGCYIYPATVIKHIDNPRRNPVALLGEVMALIDPLARVNPLAELDALYNHILRPPDTDMALMKRILHSIMVLHQTGRRDEGRKSDILYTPSFLDLFLLLPRGEVAMAMCDLHSVVRIPSATEEGAVNFFHKTLEDFLISPSRAADLHRPLYLTHLELSANCAYHSQSLVLRTDVTTRNVLEYSAYNWWKHLQLGFEDSPRDAADMLPHSIKTFDPEHIWSYQIRASLVPLAYKKHGKIHQMVCKQLDECIGLCANALRLEELSKGFEEFHTLRIEEDIANQRTWVMRQMAAKVEVIQIPSTLFIDWFAAFMKKSKDKARPVPTDRETPSTNTMDKLSLGQDATQPGRDMRIPRLMLKLRENSPPVTGGSTVGALWKTPFDLYMALQPS